MPWALLAVLFLTGPEASKNRDKLLAALAIYVGLGALAGAFAVNVAKTGARAALALPRANARLVVGIARAYFRAYQTLAPPTVIKSAIRSLVHQVLPGTVSLDTWLAAYDTSGTLRAQLEAGAIAEEDDDPLGILKTPVD